MPRACAFHQNHTQESVLAQWRQRRDHATCAIICRRIVRAAEQAKGTQHGRGGCRPRAVEAPILQ
eukprot:4216762-Karenia_brevis.AAC.1